MKFIYYCLLVFTVCLPFKVSAAEVEVTPIIGYAFGGSFEGTVNETDLDFADACNFGFIIGLKDTNKSGGAYYELLYSRQSTHLKNSFYLMPPENPSNIDFDVNYLHIGGRYGTEGKRINPYVAAGIGATYFDPEQGDSETKFSFSIGAGAIVPLTERLKLRFEGRGFGTVFNGRGAIFCDNNNCLVHVSGDLLWQFSAFTGVVFSF